MDGSTGLKLALAALDVVHPAVDVAAGADRQVAAAEFELGQWLHRNGDHDAAIPHWRNAHRLYPENWTYKRQAWTFVTTPEGQPPDLLQPPNDVYEGSWYADVVRLGGGEKYVNAPEL